MLLDRFKYKKFLIENKDLINQVLFEKYKGKKSMIIGENNEIVYENITLDNHRLQYQENENSVEYLDNWLSKYIDTFLMTPQRKQYFLDLLKRNNDIEKCEKILLDCIRKKLID